MAEVGVAWKPSGHTVTLRHAGLGYHRRPEHRPSYLFHPLLHRRLIRPELRVLTHVVPVLALTTISGRHSVHLVQKQGSRSQTVCLHSPDSEVLVAVAYDDDACDDDVEEWEAVMTAAYDAYDGTDWESDEELLTRVGEYRDQNYCLRIRF